MVEMVNWTSLSMMTTAASERPFHWQDHLRSLCMANNSSVHPTTGFSPFYLMHGRKAKMPIDIIATWNTRARTSNSVRLCHKTRLEPQGCQWLCPWYDGSCFGLADGHPWQKFYGEPFKKGDLVWLHGPAVTRGRSKKLHQPWNGPFWVVCKLSDLPHSDQSFLSLEPCQQDISLTDPALVQSHRSINAQPSRPSPKP